MPWRGEHRPPEFIEAFPDAIQNQSELEPFTMAELSLGRNRHELHVSFFGVLRHDTPPLSFYFRFMRARSSAEISSLKPEPLVIVTPSPMARNLSWPTNWKIVCARKTSSATNEMNSSQEFEKLNEELEH